MPLAHKPLLRVGMAMWSLPQWQKSILQGCQTPAARLAGYAEKFDTVEGNTSFYALPDANTVAMWAANVPASFRFTFKLPRTITHDKQLQHCDGELSEFFNRMQPLQAHTSVWKIQLPASFGPESLPILAAFIARLPAGLHYGVELRHQAFFAKGAAEQQLNRLLMQHSCDRIIMDSRPIFAQPATTEIMRDAQSKKPRVPVHAIATANMPVVRFIGDLVPENNDAFFTPWLSKLPQWLSEGKTPHLFVHTPDNIHAPELAHRLYQQLQQHIATQQPWQLDDLVPLHPVAQASLF
ncbi:DUF72 domain-containing protein [Shewanella sp. C32]|uniref:DUF72 domain-containing protein n=1 Tax=Shewanella electrica TaxID=515560 RepID=A0ABT2FLP5_9GAMM|nr:DUF72 domain-containing protein [Shewanella electrica]MCH1925495.1 DUF72 domain-containing protein [Shewanella electrica]MCS4557198.1 DUF72 domain-containing protein [Shewanella electrica]